MLQVQDHFDLFTQQIEQEILHIKDTYSLQKAEIHDLEGQIEFLEEEKA